MPSGRAKAERAAGHDDWACLERVQGEQIHGIGGVFLLTDEVTQGRCARSGAASPPPNSDVDDGPILLSMAAFALRLMIS